jgi:hypothetical protein
MNHAPVGVIRLALVAVRSGSVIVRSARIPPGKRHMVLSLIGTSPVGRFWTCEEDSTYVLTASSFSAPPIALTARSTRARPRERAAAFDGIGGAGFGRNFVGAATNLLWQSSLPKM